MTQEKEIITSSKQNNVPTTAELNAEKPSIVNTTPGKCPLHIKYENGKFTEIAFKEAYHSPDRKILQELTATHDEEISNEIVSRGASAMPQQNRLEYNYNTIFQSLSDCSPKDSTEAKLSLQSTVLYAQGMRYIEKAENSNRIDHSEFYMKNAIKLLRLHNETIDALGRYRRGGKQEVIVQHVSVSNGGQAVVNGQLLSGGATK